jgi:hypothetical protein
MKNTIIFVMSLGAALLPTAASAASTPLDTNTVVSGSALTPISSLPGNLQLQGDTGLVSFNGYNNLNQLMFTGTIDSQAYLDTNTGYIDFFYQITNTGGGAGDSIVRATMTDFTGYTTAVNYVTSSGSVAPSTIDRSSSGDTVGFNFSIPSTLDPSSTTYLLEVDTNATSYQLGTANLHDGGIATMTAFAPAPEPGSLGLLGAALSGLGMLQFKLRRRK